MQIRPFVGAQQLAWHPGMPTEGGAALHACLAVLGLPLAYPLSVMLPWVWQGSLKWAALLCGVHTRAHGASRWQGCHLAGAAVPAASRAVVLAGMLLGASSACPLLTELHRA